MGAQAAGGPTSGSLGRDAGDESGRRGEESRAYLRQLIRDTHIAGQLFKAHSCITPLKVPVGLPASSTPPPPPPPTPFGREGRESERKVEQEEKGGVLESVEATLGQSHSKS